MTSRSPTHSCAAHPELSTCPNMKHTVRTLTCLFVYALAIRCFLFSLTNKVTPNHYTISEWNTTLELPNQQSFHKNYLQACLYSNREPPIQRYTHCKYSPNATIAYNNNILQEDHFYRYPTTTAKLLKSTLKQPHRKPKGGTNRHKQKPNRSPKLTRNQLRWINPLQYTTKIPQSSETPPRTTEHFTHHKQPQPQPHPNQKTASKLIQQDRRKKSVRAQPAHASESPKPQGQEAQHKKNSPIASREMQEVRSSQTYPQLSQMYGKRARSPCEGPSDSARTKSNDDQRNPSKKLPYATTPQEAPQPTKSQQPNNPRRSKQPHKRTPLDTLILPHSEDRAEVSNESRERERFQTVDYALPIEHPENVVATKAIAEWKLRKNSKAKIESESSNRITLRSKGHSVEEGLPKSGTSKARPATELQQSCSKVEAKPRRHTHISTRSRGPAEERATPKHRHITSQHQKTTPKTSSSTKVQHRRPAPRTESQHRPSAQTASFRTENQHQPSAQIANTRSRTQAKEEKHDAEAQEDNQPPRTSTHPHRQERNKVAGGRSQSSESELANTESKGDNTINTRAERNLTRRQHRGHNFNEGNREVLHNPPRFTSATWPNHPGGLRECVTRARAGLYPSFFIILQSISYAPVQHASDGCTDVTYNENSAFFLPAISHRLRQHRVCVPETWTFMNCMITRKYCNDHTRSMDEWKVLHIILANWTSNRNELKCLHELKRLYIRCPSWTNNMNNSKHCLDEVEMLCVKHFSLTSNYNKFKYYPYFEYPADSIFFINRNMTLPKVYLDNKVSYTLLRKWIMNLYSRIVDCSLHVKHIKHFFLSYNIQIGPQLNLWNGFVIRVIRSMDFNLALQKLCNLLRYCICHRMSTSSNVAATTRKLFENDSIDTLSNGQKRQVSAMVVASQKKAKGKENTFQRPPFWLGFHTLNAIACENGDLVEPTLSVTKLVKLGMAHEEALEHLEAVPSFPYIPQEAWPSKRMDGKEGGHFNLTQVPFDVEVDEEGFALDYQIAITFELCDRDLSRDDIYMKTESRLKAMGIQLGEILGEPIAILCFHGSKRWSGTIKLHLKNPKKDANDLLNGTRSFILKLDSITHCRGKVFKSFDSIAIASLLSVKISSPTLKDKKWFQLHEEIVKDSFKRGYEFEITNVQKNDNAEFAWVKTPSPEQAKRIKTYKISFFNEIMEVNFASTEKLSEDDKARKNAVVLIAKNLNKTKTTVALEEGIKKLFGEENVAGIFFRLEKGKHVGSCNVQCLNATVYKKYVKQNHLILGKYVEFSPHPKSLDGIDAPSAIELARLGFADVNTALANTIQALENAPTKGYTKADMTKMVEEAINKGAVEIRKEMSLLKEEIVEEARVYADKVQAESNRNSRIQIALLQKQMRIALETLQADHPDTPEIEGNMDLSN